MPRSRRPTTARGSPEVSDTDAQKTMDLRFIERRSPDNPPRRLLQQRVILADGSDSWLDIPFVPDGAEEVGG